MKKVIFVLVVFVMLFSLVACGKSSDQVVETGNTAALSTAAELLIGTIKLDETDQAVTSDQAKQLLPLWQMMQSLSTSSTSASEEIQAVVNQIKSSMTSAQLEQITGMDLTQQDLMTLMSQNMASNRSSSESTPMAFNGMPNMDDLPSGAGAPPFGDMASGGGGPPAGMASGGSAPAGGFPAAGDPGATGRQAGMSSTPQAFRSNGMADQIPAPLLNALIEFLKKKIQS